jgi:hypothetical protein
MPRSARLLAVAALLACLAAASGCAPGAAPPSASPTHVAAAAPTRHDWANATYQVTCDGRLLGTVTAQLKDGAATVPVDVSESPSYDHVDVRLQTTATGDLNGDGKPETAVLLQCSPQPSNASLQEVHVFRADGSQLAVLPSADVLPQATILAPVYVPSGLVIRDGQIVAAMLAYGPNDSHATGPSQPITVRWRWTGTGFAPLP